MVAPEGNSRRLARVLLCASLACASLLPLPLAAQDKTFFAPADEPNPNPPLWKVEGAHSTIYLFGAIHLLPDYVMWSSPSVTEAMTQSQVFVFESPDDNGPRSQTGHFILNRGMMQPGKKLRSLLSTDAQNMFDQRIAEFGYRPEKFDDLNPWLASLILKVTFLQTLGYTSDSGADTKIESYAREHGRNFRYLETPQVGLRALAIMGEMTGVQSVETTLANMDEMPAILQDLIGRWQTGDVAGLNRLLNDSLMKYPDIAKILLLDRNRAWSQTIGKMAQTRDTFFVTVGIAHLAGNGSLIQELCARGLRVSRVDTPAPSNACPLT